MFYVEQVGFSFILFGAALSTSGFLGSVGSLADSDEWLRFHSTVYDYFFASNS